MPEGHVLHRAARLQGKKFNGETVSVSSPQGRFAAGAARLDGQRLERIDAHGKHLFYRFESGDNLHVHLGLFGKFRLNTPPYPEPSPNCRVLMETDQDQLHLAGPNQCDVIDPDEMASVLDRLGPDPIVAPKDGADQLAATLAKRSIPIGKAIMDQSIIAGIGNVYRSELLFKIGVHPWRVSKELDRATIQQLWDLSVRELKAGERAGKIVTVDPDDADGLTRSKLKRAERLYAYKRQGKPCRRCGELILAADIDGRNAWWCPTCQLD